MRARSAALWMLLLIGLQSGVAASDQEFQQATLAFQNGDYDSALKTYQGILASGLENGNLHYNIGNCYFKLNQLGPAILHYERAKRLLGNDEDLAVNLELANLRTLDRITPLPEFWLVRAARWAAFALPSGWLWRIVSGAWLLLGVALALAILRWPPIQPFRLPLCVGLALLLLGGLGPLIGQSAFSVREGVVLSEEVRVLSAPGEGVEVFRIHEGTKFRVDAQAGDWLEIVLADGKVGWLQRHEIGEI